MNSTTLSSADRAVAYDELLAARIRAKLSHRSDVVERKMFGGLCFMVSDHMCCGITGNVLMARVGLVNCEACLAHRYTMEMDFTGKSLTGMVYARPDGLATKPLLSHWLRICTDFVDSLPPKRK